MFIILEDQVDLWDTQQLEAAYSEALLCTTAQNTQHNKPSAHTCLTQKNHPLLEPGSPEREVLGVELLQSPVRRSEVICIEIALGVLSGTLEIPLLVYPQEISSATRQSLEVLWMGRGNA